MIELRVFTAQNGKAPFDEWLLSLDRNVRLRVTARLGRLQSGNFGDAKPVGEGVFELRLDFGPGYRVYYGRQGPAVVILLVGGDKSTQARDVVKAQEHWRSYLKE